MRSRCRDIGVAWHEVGRGTPIVLIHGLADDHRAWRRALPDLVMRRRALLYDFRGHGETDLGQADGTLKQLGDDLMAWMDAVELEKGSVAGFSLGGTIAMRAAIDHPERIESLVLVATSSRVGQRAAEWYRERVEMVERGDPTVRATIDADSAAVYANRPSELEEGLLIRRESTGDPRGWANACRAMYRLNAEPLDPELDRIKAPTLIVAGAADANCPPRAAEIISAGIPGSRLEVIPDTGHMIPVERGEQTARLILGHTA